jgi:hypothetical protein
VNHRIHDRTIADPISFARVREQIGRIAHALHAASNDDFGVVCLNCLGCKTHGLESGSTNFVDCHGSDIWQKTGTERCLSCGILSKTGGYNIAHNHFVDLLRF